MKDVNIDDVVVAPLTSSLQMSKHVANIRRDAPWLGAASPRPFDATRRFYDWFEDDADLLVVASNVMSISNPFYSPLRNDIEGIGLSLFDRGAMAGIQTRLQGLIAVPRAARLDLAGDNAMHEIAHRWVNHLDEIPLLAPGRSHWPISDLAHGLIGFSLLNGAGGTFPFQFRETDEGYLLRRANLLTGITASSSISWGWSRRMMSGSSPSPSIRIREINYRQRGFWPGRSHRSGSST